jgi:hypothetical protein
MDNDVMLAMLRRDEEEQLTARCDITRPADGGATIDADGRYTPAPASTVHADYPCRVRPSQRATRTVDFGGEQVTVHLYDVKVPQDCAAKKGDVVTVRASRDAALVDRPLIVREATHDEYVVTRVLLCEESR